MADPLNYSGATIFWLYIVAALVFTGTALHAILSIPAPQPAPPPHAKSPAVVFALLAATSFAILSFNMLHVLIHSFTLWSPLHPLSPSSFSSPSLPISLLSVIQRIWSWSTTSTLFHDFASALVASRARALWTQAALLGTLFQGFELALYGRRFRIPRLGAFFAVAQILPVSFAQNLLYLAVLRRRASTGQAKAKGEAGEGEGDATVAAEWASVVVVWYGFLALGLAPWAAGVKGRGFGGADYLIWTILGARALLAVPFFLVRTGNGPGEVGVGRVWVGRSILVLGLVAFGLRHGWVFVEKGSFREVGSALFEHPAVTALGMDFVVSMVSLGIWNSLPADRGRDLKTE